MIREILLGTRHGSAYDSGMLILVRMMYILGGLLFFGSVVAHICVRVWLRPRDPDLDDVYYEFEDEHPEYARYSRWLRITMATGTLGMLMAFVAVAL
jgi:hypothetical protein